MVLSAAAIAGMVAAEKVHFLNPKDGTGRQDRIETFSTWRRR